MKYIFLLLLITIPFLTFAQSKRTYKKEVKKFRKHYQQEFLKEARSPFYNHKKGMRDMRFYKAKRKYKLTTKFKRTNEAVPFKMSTYSGNTQDYVLYGIATVDLDGKKVPVHIYQSLRLREMEEYKDHLFIPFNDLTNDESTYGGGRYIDLKMSDIKDDQVVIDFNRCYNPWCAFSDGYNCPVPPKENHFEVKIEAGEKMFVGEKKK
jgi:uncharacterized protein (DUF1684 family)